LGCSDREVQCVTLPPLRFVVFFSVRLRAAVPTTRRLSLAAVLGSLAAEDQVGRVDRAEEPAEVAGRQVERGAELEEAEALREEQAEGEAPVALVAAPEVQGDRAGPGATSFEFPGPQLSRLIPCLPPFPSRDS